MQGETATVKVTPDTRYRKGREDAKFADLKVGDHIGVHGEKTGDNAFAAQAVMIAPPGGFQGGMGRGEGGPGGMGGVLLAHKATKEGRIAVEVITGEDSAFVDIIVPAVVFTDPEVAWCGLTEAEAKGRAETDGWIVREDAGRGWRRVVASPIPQRIVEADAIHKLIENGFVVVAVGGGGIPVVRENGAFTGIEAVIDKDRASALLASRLPVDYFIISTDADRVYRDYRKPTQQPIDRATADEVERDYRAGQFPPGNMGPKIESALRFLRSGGREVIITSYDLLADAVRGKAGTHITAS